SSASVSSCSRSWRSRFSGTARPCTSAASAGRSATSTMTKIADLLATGPTRSYEFFPPKNDDMERQLDKAVAELAPLGPSFVSVTYGALGSTRDRTRDIVIRLNGEQTFPCMAHLTCVGHTRADI